jgi:hypothetical protein
MVHIGWHMHNIGVCIVFIVRMHNIGVHGVRSIHREILLVPAQCGYAMNAC